MKVLTAEEMRACDRQAMVHTPAPLLMEIAGREVAGCIIREELYKRPGGVIVLNGSGNNGGDGYVVARHLHCCGAVVVAYTLVPVEELREEVREKADLFRAAGGKIELINDSDKTALQRFAEACRDARVVVDALYGVGFHGQLPNAAVAVTKVVNALRERANRPVIVALDIPSGVNASTGEVAADAVKADLTVAIQAAKLGELIEPGASHCGRMLIVDAGIFSDVPGAVHLTRAPEVSCMLSRFFRQPPSAHKGDRGHVLVLGGAVGKVGAAKLAALAALKCGAGLATVALPQTEQRKFQYEQWEVMSTGVPASSGGYFNLQDVAQLVPILYGKKAVVVGPGFGLEETSASSLIVCFSALAAHQSKVPQSTVPLVVDADALSLIAHEAEVARVLPPGAILTPHPGEAARLLDCSVAEIESDRVRAAKEIAARYRCWAILKGARTIIASPPVSGSGMTKTFGGMHIWMNPHVTRVLATAGSGDVLSGVLGALLASGATSMEACRAAVFAHGLGGVTLEAELGGGSGGTAVDIATATARALNALLATEEWLRFPLPGMPLEFSAFG